jgi:hypothetical protein
MSPRALSSLRLSWLFRASRLSATAAVGMYLSDGTAGTGSQNREVTGRGRWLRATDEVCSADGTDGFHADQAAGSSASPSGHRRIAIADRSPNFSRLTTDTSKLDPDKRDGCKRPPTGRAFVRPQPPGGVYILATITMLPAADGPALHAVSVVRHRARTP